MDLSAVDDAAYKVAVNSDARPSKKWVIPTKEEYDAYMSNMEQKNPKGLEAHSICTGSLGLFLFLESCREQGKDNMCDFIAEVAAFRTLVPLQIAANASRIIKNYLTCSAGNGENSFLVLPVIMNIFMHI